ncbi:DUF3597 domain-containing protein [Erythrobacter litoralis]|uniref:DUF3597 domain-containing protein n=1 Tax=Erythrobacter litoralis (strain HTCC2594) TaxID=314225 RepID=Q2NCR7_ERYLH|nr:DUF3597 domain-containing protein [Erythrobacter litoralis]ABC62524.1 hypothetical protein ELI_02160 [Erythrobacter litoralis HTCC2594]
MGIFSSIKNAIFGDDEDEKKAPPPQPRPVPTPAASPTPQAKAMNAIDVVARLSAKPGADRLNWKTSIVDLFKLLDLDPSYENRKELAQELGRTDYSGSAEDNIWLHRATMAEIAKNGGKVPPEMLN